MNLTFTVNTFFDGLWHLHCTFRLSHLVKGFNRDCSIPGWVNWTWRITLANRNRNRMQDCEVKGIPRGSRNILGAIKNLPVVEVVYRKFAAFSEYIKQPFGGSKVKSLHFYCTRQRKRWSPLKLVGKLFHKFRFSATLKTKASPIKNLFSV